MGMKLNNNQTNKLKNLIKMEPKESSRSRKRRWVSLIMESILVSNRFKRNQDLLAKLDVTNVKIIANIQKILIMLSQTLIIRARMRMIMIILIVKMGIVVETRIIREMEM